MVTIIVIKIIVDKLLLWFIVVMYNDLKVLEIIITEATFFPSGLFLTTFMIQDISPPATDT